MQRTSWFFVGMSVVFLVLVLVGFSQSLFLRDYFGTLDKLGGQQLPLHVQLHGILLASWFVFFAIQASLVTAHRTDLHRGLGPAGALLAVLVVAVSVWTLILAFPRDALSGGDPAVSAARMFANVTTLTVFAGCVARAVYLRKQPDAHKRLMLFASISITGQAATRIAPLVGLPEVAFAGATLLALVLALVAYDLVSLRRIHAATTWGVVFFLLCFALSALLRRSGIGGLLVALLT